MAADADRLRPVSIMNAVRQIRSTGHVTRGQLGVQVGDVQRDQLAELGLANASGAFVGGVQNNSAAARAGIRPGDVIIAFNGKEIGQSSELPPLVGAMVLIPAYNEYFAVKKAMNFVAQNTQPTDQDMNAIGKMLDKQFNVGYVDNVAGSQATLIRNNTGNILVMDYEVRKAFVYNIDFVVKFKNQVVLGGGKSGKMAGG